MWPVLSTLAVAVLFVWLLVRCIQLEHLLRDTARDDRLSDRLVERYGGSVSWNDETPASLESNRGSAATRSRKG